VMSETSSSYSSLFPDVDQLASNSQKQKFLILRDSCHKTQLFFWGRSLFCMKSLMADLTPDDSPTAIEGREASDDLIAKPKRNQFGGHVPLETSLTEFSFQEKRKETFFQGANSSAEKVTFSGTTSTPFRDEAFFQSCRRKFQCRKDCNSRTTSTPLKDEGFFNPIGQNSRAE